MPEIPQAQKRIQQADRCAEHFCALLACTEPVIPDAGSLAGPVFLNRRALQDQLGGSGPHIQLGEDNLHFSLNVETLLDLGFHGIRDRALKRAAAIPDEEPAAYLRAIARCYTAVLELVQAHADTASRMASQASGEEQQRLARIAARCRALAQGPPRTFPEAVQLFWLAWNIRGHGTIGRLDQHLYPFYRRDVDAGRLTQAAAFEILCQLWEGFNASGSGDTLMNLMLSGRDHLGNDETNELSYLMLDVALAVRKSEPHLSVRVHAGTPAPFLDKVAQLQTLGHGQGTIYNDDAIVPSLVRLEVPLESACAYANDGCTEVTIDGESGIRFLQMEALKTLELTLFNGEENALPGAPLGRYINRDHPERQLRTALKTGFRSGNFATMTSFEQIFDAYLLQYGYQLDMMLARLDGWIRQSRAGSVSSPFMAGTFPRCLETGLDPVRGGFTVSCNMIFAGSIPTVADGLAAIRRVVFTDRFCTPAELLDALRANFEGWELLRQRCLAAPKFGNDDDDADQLAARIARFFCARVAAHRAPDGKPVWPALYNFLFNDTTKIVGATPDGRRWQDPVAEHYSPTPGRARSGPTAVIRSAAKGPLAEACGSSIFHVSLSRSMVRQDEAGRRLLMQLMRSALQLGAAVMNIAIYDVAELRRA
ncbi:MAG: pyruvate formate lyase family protein, partial [Acidobacteriota bacterium]